MIGNGKGRLLRLLLWPLQIQDRWMCLCVGATTPCGTGGLTASGMIGHRWAVFRVRFYSDILGEGRLDVFVRGIITR